MCRSEKLFTLQGNIYCKCVILPCDVILFWIKILKKYPVCDFILFFFIKLWILKTVWDDLNILCKYNHIEGIRIIVNYKIFSQLL